MRKVFVSQPMRGVSEEDIEAQRARILASAVTYFGEPVGEIPKADPAQLVGRHPAYSLGLSLQLMSGADLVIFADGWDDARGCQIEHEVCVQYDIPYKYEWEL